MRPRDQLVTRLVEADVAIGADPEDLEIDSAGRVDLAFVPLAFRVDVRGGPVEEVDAFGWQVDAVEEVPMHVLPETAAMRRADADELVEVEGRRLCKGDLARSVQPAQLRVGHHRRSSRRETQHERRTLTERGGDPSGERAGDELRRVEHVDDHS